MENIDALIREALTDEEAKFYKDLEEQDLFSRLEEVYRGKLGWLAILMNLIMLILFGIFVFCAFKFAASTDPGAQISWAATGFLCILAVGMLKLYFWMQMDKNDIKRELKRIELQIAALSARLHRE